MSDLKIIKAPTVQLISAPYYIHPVGFEWAPSEEGKLWDVRDGDTIPEFSGRLCYLSFGAGEKDGHKTIGGRPNNSDYIRHILESGHGSVLEHSNFGILMEGVSRSLTHELVRHRHFSFSQLSQRYVDESQVAFVLPPEIEEGSAAYGTFVAAANAALYYYRSVLHETKKKVEAEVRCTCQTDNTNVPYVQNDAGELRCALCTGSGWVVTKTEILKRARQTARAVLPNATETKIIVTGNARAWRQFIDQRANKHADTEIRRLAVAVLRCVQEVAPHIFGDYVITRREDGTEVAEGRYQRV